VECQVVSSAASDGACRQDWACAESGLLSVVCVASDGGGASCVCSNGEDLPAMQFNSDNLDCSAGGNIVWAQACGWDVSP
jgi:hypothetical protein